jgi:hypothetical protein
VTDMRAQLEGCGYSSLQYGHEAGIYRLPDEWVETYRELIDGAQSRTADKLFHTLAAMTSGPGIEQGASALILRTVQPALAERMATFVADVELLGPYAEFAELSGSQAGELLAAGPDVAAAFARHLQTSQWYQLIRSAWLLLRQREVMNADDPRGTDSLLAEVENAPHVLPDTWRSVGNWTARGFAAPPWTGTAASLRLGWIVRAGGKVWAPTTAQHNEAWARHAPPKVHQAGASHSTTSDFARSGR